MFALAWDNRSGAHTYRRNRLHILFLRREAARAMLALAWEAGHVKMTYLGLGNACFEETRSRPPPHALRRGLLSPDVLG